MKSLKLIGAALLASGVLVGWGASTALRRNATTTTTGATLAEKINETLSIPEAHAQNRPQTEHHLHHG